MEKLTKLKKDVIQIMQIINNKGVQEREFSAKSSWYDWTGDEKALKAQVEKVYEKKLMTLFYDLRKKLNRIATQDEYVEAYLKISFNKIEKQSWYNVWEKDFIQNCVIWRADRAYKSNLIEIMTAEQLEQRGYTVFKELYIDFIAGVDLVAVKDGKCWYIHVTKDSKWAREKVLTKGEYKDYYLNSKKFKYERDFTNHAELFYSNDESENNVVKNGLPLFKFDYLADELGEWNCFNWDNDNQIVSLMKIMKNAGAVYSGYKWKSTNNKLVIN